MHYQSKQTHDMAKQREETHRPSCGFRSIWVMRKCVVQRGKVRGECVLIDWVVVDEEN